LTSVNDLGWISKLNAHLTKSAVDFQIDFLLNIHELSKITALDKINDLKIQRKNTKFLEMPSIKSDIGFG